jgi:hypothetical protein
VLPEYDNALLSHADRTRYTPEDMNLLATDGPVHGTALVDGDIAATWSAARDGVATMTVRHLPRLPRRARQELAAEAERALRFLEPDADDHEVRLVPAGP